MFQIEKSTSQIYSSEYKYDLLMKKYISVNILIFFSQHSDKDVQYQGSHDFIFQMKPWRYPLYRIILSSSFDVRKFGEE